MTVCTKAHLFDPLPAHVTVFQTIRVMTHRPPAVPCRQERVLGVLRRSTAWTAARRAIVIALPGCRWWRREVLTSGF